MADKVLLVTAPDDSLENAIRISVVGLSPDQSAIVSQALTEMQTPDCLVAYIWQSSDPVEWIIDKIYKSHAIVFNADHENQTLMGYVAAKSNAHYFGVLRSLSAVNPSVIYDLAQCRTVLEKCFEKHSTLSPNAE